MSDNSKSAQNGSKDLDFIERARALDKAATEGPWRRWDGPMPMGTAAVETSWCHRGDGTDTELIAETGSDADAEFIAAARAMLPAAVEALARVRELHRKCGLYELEDACTNDSEEHIERRHHECSDDGGEYYCEDMPVGAVCDVCRDEDGERLDWPCATWKATEVEG